MKKTFLIPLITFICLIIAFGVKLTNDNTNKKTTSPLIGKEIPSFDLPSIYENNPRLSENDIKTNNTYVLINFFASWCLPCLVEHPLLMSLKDNHDLTIYGINWKDKKKDAKNWLKKHGNPYDKIGSDILGKTAIDFGITGAPETFLISPESKIIYKHVGPITEEIIKNDILPLIKSTK